MTRTVKFRLDDQTMDALEDIADGASISECLRALIHAEKKRRSTRKKGA